MKKILIFLQILIIFGPCGVKAYEVNTEWIKNWGGNNTDGIKATMVLDDNSVVAVGLTNSNVDEINVNGQDALIIKYDKEGNVIWQKNCGGIKDDVFSSVTLISDGSIIAVGKEENSSSVLPMIVKYDQDGNVIWQKSWGGNTYSQFDSVVASSDGGFIAAGSTYSNLDGINNQGGSDAVIVKYDQDGNVEWQKGFGGNNWDAYRHIITTNDGGYIATGGTTSNNIDGFTLKGREDVFVVKYDQDGNLMWKKDWGGTETDAFKSIVQLADNGYVVVGETTSKNIDGMTFAESNDAIIVKYDQNGKMLWQKTWAGNAMEWFESAVATPDGGFIAAGASYSSNLGIDNAGQGDAVIVKFDKEGNVEWNKSIGGSGNDGYGHIISTLDGGYVATGYLLSTDIAGLAHKGNQDILIVKYMFEYDIDNKITQNGTSTVEQQGSKGIINATPNQGYKIDKILVYDTKGNEVAVTKEENGTYSFELYDDVTVEVTYLKNAENIEIENPQTDDNIMPKVICALLLMLSSCVFYKFSGKKYSN